MSDQVPAIETRNLVRRYGRTDAVDGLSLRVAPGRCYGFFGRNGAGKTTTIKCLLNLLRPTSGEARVFGLDPTRNEVAVKSRVAYVPDHVAFYPWMTVRETLAYVASFGERWNRETEATLLTQFQLDGSQKTNALLLVGFAFVNHRQDQPATARIWRQTLSVAALVGFGLVVLETAHF